MKKNLIADLDQVIEAMSSDKSNDWSVEVGCLTRVQDALGQLQDLTSDLERQVLIAREGAPVLTWKGRHRTWFIFERKDTAAQDKFTVTADVIPSDAAVAAIEGGRFPDMNAAYAALLEAEATDDGDEWE